MKTQVPVRSLEARYYTDPALYERERSGLFMSSWQYACHVSEIPERGNYVSFSVAGQSLFAIRMKDGDIACYYNVCQHRAHELVSGSGHCKLIVCPYHAWTYELDGRMRSGPNIASVEGFDRSEIRLASVRSEDFNGFLFVNLDKDAAPMEEWFPGARAQLRQFVPHIDALKPAHQVSVAEKCNWKVSVENYSECYHCSLNHPTFVSGVVRPETYNIQPQGYCLRHTTECQNLDKMSYSIDVHANETAGSYSSWFLWPTFSFQVYPGNMLNTYHWVANAADQVSVTRGWYSEDGSVSDVLLSLAEQDKETTLAEDVKLVESVQRGLNSKGYTPGPLVVDPKSGVQSEHSIRALQSWMREAVA